MTAPQLISALASNFAVHAGGRVLCALTHGLMWWVIAPIGVRLVPASNAGRATTAVTLAAWVTLPPPQVVGCLAALAIAYAVLSALAFRDHPGFRRRWSASRRSCCGERRRPRCRRCCRRRR